MTTPQFTPPDQDPVPAVDTEPVGAAMPGPARRPAGSRVLNVALGVALVVAVAGVAFAVGRATSPATTLTAGAGPFVTDGILPGASFDPSAGGFPGGGAVPGGGGGIGPRGGLGLGGGMTIEGTVDSVAADAVTVKTESGQTITVGLDAGTTYHQQADATAADVVAGSTVILTLEGGFRPGAAGNGSGGATLGSASDVTVVP